MAIRHTGWAALVAGGAVALLLADWGGALPARPTERGQRGGEEVAGGGAGPQAGQACTVYLRGDATGANFNDRIPSLGNLVPVRGTVVRNEGPWFVMTVDGQETWVPRASIALVKLGEGEKGK